METTALLGQETPKAEEKKVIHTAMMLDLETLDIDTRKPVITEIGIAKLRVFEDYSFLVTPSYEFRLNAYEQLLGGRTASKEILRWWADRIGIDYADNPQNLMQVVEYFSPAQYPSFEDLIAGFAGVMSLDNFDTIWSLGSNFDLTIMSNVFKDLDLQSPWHYRTERCYRTFRKLLDNYVPPTVGTTAHTAIKDAEAQATELGKTLQALNVVGAVQHIIL